MVLNIMKGRGELMSHGLIVDLFAGGGGASLGMEMALGRAVDVAVNHNPEAVAIHELNHPGTRHFVQNICQIHPLDATGAQPVDVLWASPDCKHFSKAKGTAPKARNIRELAWAVVHWVRYTNPKLVIIENVEEFQGWGPIDGEGKPIKEKAGETFKRWLAALERLGYRADFRRLRACDYGAPTIRRRLFIVARRDGRAVAWPEAGHGPGQPLPYRTAAECIDWSIPVPSIFGRKRPLVENTLKRIAEGLRRYVLEAEAPFIVAPDDAAFLIKSNHTADYYQCFRGQGLDEPLQTVTQSPGFSLVKAHLVAPFIQHMQHGGLGCCGVMPGNEPLRTVTDYPKGGGMALVTAYLAHFYGTMQDGDITKPLKTVTSKNHIGVVAAFLTKYYGKSNCQALDEPLATVTTAERFGLMVVQIKGEPYVIADIGLRMLTPRELARAQGFPDGYKFDPVMGGRPLSQKAQVAAIGNSVPPPFAHALVKANMDALEYSEKPRRLCREDSKHLPFPAFQLNLA